VSSKISRKKVKQIMHAPAVGADAPNLSDPLFTERQTTALLGLKNHETLAVWRCTKRYPLSFVRVGRLVRYRLSAIEAFLRARTENGDERKARA